ncbi:MAG: zinc ribbon domain-containing protein [Acidobacteriota bacterium]
MPLFDYVCQECNHRFEVLVRKSDEKIQCPKCQSEKTERQLARPAGGKSDQLCGQ